MKIMRFIFTTILISFLVGIALFFSFTALSSQTRELLISKIPFFGNKTQVNFATRTAVLSESNMLTMKTASFEIDFLMNLTHGEEQYIALYPYQVTAGIDLHKASFNIENNNVIVDLGDPEITSSSSDTAKVLVLRDTLRDQFSDYETYSKPVKKAFEQKALDEAVNSGIYEKCKEHAAEYFSSLFTGYDISFSGTLPSSETHYEVTESPSLPVVFKLGNMWNIEGKQLLPIVPSYQSRDELLFKLDYAIDPPQNKIVSGDAFFRYGAISHSKIESFSILSEKIKKTGTEKDLILTYSNPLDDDNRKTILFADERGYYLSYTAFKDGSISYLESKGVQGEESIQDYSPALVYASMSIDYDPVSLTEEKRQAFYTSQAYISLYDNAFNAMNKKNYAAVNQFVSVLFAQEENNPDIVLLSSLVDFLYKQEYRPTNLPDFQQFDDELKVAHIIKTNTISALDESNREKLIASYFNEKRLKEYFEAYFLKYKKELNLSEKEIELYTDDLIQSGAVITKELFTSLSDEERKEYLQNIIIYNDEENIVRIENDGGVTYILCGSAYEKIYSQKNKGPQYIQKKIARTGQSVNSKVLLVFPEKKFFTEYSALVFEAQNVMLFNNISSILFVNEGIHVPYSGMSFYGDNFKLGNFSYSDTLVRSILLQLHEVYSREESYALDISGDLSAQLIQTIYSIMDRPQL